VVIEKASGARADRPELARLLRDMLRDGDTLVIWKLDRLARSLKQLIQTAEDLMGRGIGLVSLTDAIDTSSPGGMLVFHMLGAIAESEGERWADRVYTDGKRTCRLTAFGPSLFITQRAFTKRRRTRFR
jgi:DNA invertase Pin-like site-specific DNA recombinase